jgi:hypothetical protein
MYQHPQQQTRPPTNGRIMSKVAFLKAYPETLTKGGLDYLIFCEKQSMLKAGAILKLGSKRLWIDEDRFKSWLRSRSQEEVA